MRSSRMRSPLCIAGSGFATILLVASTTTSCAPRCTLDDCPLREICNKEGKCIPEPNLLGEGEGEGEGAVAEGEGSAAEGEGDLATR